MAGAVDSAEALKSARALLHTADREPFGIAIAEALASGVPVAAPAAGGPAEIVDESCGRLFAPGDADAGAAALREVLDDRDALGEGARRRAEERYDLERARAQFAQLVARHRTGRERDEEAGAGLALVTVTHDSAAELETLLASVARHLPGAQLVVADSGSQDASAAGRPATWRGGDRAGQCRLRDGRERRRGGRYETRDRGAQPGRRAARRLSGGSRRRARTTEHPRAAARPGCRPAGRQPSGRRAARARIAATRRGCVGSARRPAPTAADGTRPVALGVAAASWLAGRRVYRRRDRHTSAPGTVRPRDLPVRGGPRPRAARAPTRESRRGSDPTRAFCTAGGTRRGATASRSSCSRGGDGRSSRHGGVRLALGSTTSSRPSRSRTGSC